MPQNERNTVASIATRAIVQGCLGVLHCNIVASELLSITTTASLFGTTLSVYTTASLLGHHQINEAFDIKTTLNRSYLALGRHGC